MYSPEQVKDHVERGLRKLLTQFREKPVIEAVLRSWLKQIQKAEDAAWEVITIRGIEEAEGAGLDQIGNVVKRKRLGLGDSDYRIALRGQIRINRSAGTAEDLIAVTDLSLPSGFTASYDEEYPATVRIEVFGEVDFTIGVLFDSLVHTKAGGVKLFLIWAVQPPENSFSFAPPGDIPVNNPAAGFANTTQTTGGHLVSVLGS